MFGKQQAVGPRIMNKNQRSKTENLRLISKPRGVKKNNFKKAVVLLSGGLDSATALYIAKKQGYQVHCLTFDYGQKHKKEVFQARKIAKRSNSKWRLVRFELPWKGSSLINKNKSIPKKRNLEGNIPSTYVPGRNIIFLSFAASFAESIRAQAIFIGANEIDFSGYPDCRKEFLQLFENTLQIGTKSGVQGKKISIHFPLVKKNKAEIIIIAKKLGVPIQLTWSCYKGKKYPCGVCDSCVFRKRGFNQAKIKDPAL